MKRVFWISDFS